MRRKDRGFLWIGIKKKEKKHEHKVKTKKLKIIQNNGRNQYHILVETISSFKHL